jgi:choline dehydrogenase-like flavoprotein
VTRPAADVLVVGSGPAGAAAAWALVRSGLDVLMLEAGTRPPDDRFAVMDRALVDEIPWDFRPVPYEMIGDDIELNRFCIRKVGGSSLSWGGIAPRYHRSDFRLRSTYGIGLDWPLTYDDLEPWYAEAEQLMGVAGSLDNPWAAPRSTPFPMPGFPMNDSDLLVKRACEPLGLQIHTVPVARNSVPYRGRSACIYYATCRACPIGAVYTSDQTVAELELGPRFRLVTEAEVMRVEADAQGAARRVVYLDAEGREQAAEAPRIVMAVQNVETVRILLASATTRFPDGLANRSGTLGRFLLDHPKFYLRARVEQRLHPHRQEFETGTSSQFHDHARRGEMTGGRLIVRENAGPTVPDIAMGSGHWGEELRREIRELFGRYVTIGAFTEQLPYEDNRVTLSRTVTLRDGSPAARVEFQLAREYEWNGYEELKRTILRIFDALQAEEVRVVMEPSNAGHYMGGHRMGRDPAASVTDSYLECHDVPGLFLASAGAFPTGGINGPTLTTVALALRMADRIASRR